jgi:hypothetical protein
MLMFMMRLFDIPIKVDLRDSGALVVEIGKTARNPE